jgi:flagellar basal-body rod protein FlgG
MKQSGDPLHLAIGGEGFFRVVNAAGTELYTRAGDFHRDAAGNLVNAKGYTLQPAVTIPEDIVDVYIDSAGHIWGRAEGEADVVELGVIQIALFASQDGLQNVGENAFIPTPASGPAQMGDASTEGRGTLMSGFLEESNVDLANEMTDILRSQRAYSLSLRALHTADEIFRLANELPRV